MSDIDQELNKINRRLDQIFEALQITEKNRPRAQGMSGILARGTSQTVGLGYDVN